MPLIVSSGLLVLDIRPLSDYQKLLISSNLTFDAIAKKNHF